MTMKIMILPFLLSVFVMLFHTLNEAHANTTRVDTDETVTIDEHGTCKRVSNSSTDIMVPHKTSNEWSRFISNAPSHVDFAQCGGTWTLFRDDATIISQYAGQHCMEGKDFGDLGQYKRKSGMPGDFQGPCSTLGERHFCIMGVLIPAGGPMESPILRVHGYRCE